MDTMVLDQVIGYLYKRVQDSFTRAQIFKDVFFDNATIPVDAILIHVVTDGYVIRWPFSEDGKTNILKDKFSLSIPGILKQQNAGFNGLGLYQAAEIERQEAKEKEDKLKDNQLVNSTSERWVKKYWWIMLIIGWLGGVATTMTSKYLEKRYLPDTKSDKTAPSIKDSTKVKNDSLQLKP